MEIPSDLPEYNFIQFGRAIKMSVHDKEKRAANGEEQRAKEHGARSRGARSQEVEAGAGSKRRRAGSVGATGGRPA
jgi:hypothetical protein